MIIPDPIPVPRWPFAVLTGLLALAAVALAADRFLAPSPTSSPDARWTAETRPIRLSIADHALRVPANMIVNARQRDGGVLTRLDLALRWPSLSGYDALHAPLFETDDPALIRVWVESGSTTVTDAGNTAIAEEGERGGATLHPEIYPVTGGLFARAFTASSAYAGEEIVYEATGLRSGTTTAPFAARCKTGAPDTATCLRRVPFVDGLTLTYRFPRPRLSEWARLDRSVRDLAAGFVTDAP